MKDKTGADDLAVGADSPTPKVDGSGRPPARLRRVEARRRRRALGALALAAAGGLPLLVDLCLRLPRFVTGFTRLHWLGYIGGGVASMLIWTTLLLAASRRRGALRHASAVIFVAGFAIVFGIVFSFRAMWNIYLSRDGMEHVISLGRAITGSAPLTRVLPFALLAGVVAALLVVASRRFYRASKRPALAAAFVGPAMVFAAWQLLGSKFPASYREIQSTPPDLIWLDGVVVRTRKDMSGRYELIQPRQHDPVPPLAAKPARPRNVVLLLQETQRADEACVRYDPACEKAANVVNPLLPARVGFEKARANATCTLTSMGILLSGLSPTAPRAAAETAPFLWHFADAAGITTAYWSAQHGMYANFFIYPNDVPGEVIIGTHIDTMANMWYGCGDQRMARYISPRWAKLKEPYFTVVHFSNNHTPRLVEPSESSFTPWSRDESKKDEYRNFYRNVVRGSDVAVANVIQSIRATEAGKRAVLIYTADHGEGLTYRARWGHCSTIFDDELRVPLWIDAPEGTLSDEERQSLEAAKDQYVYHLDVSATILDLLGLWDAPELAEYRKRWLGQPLTRPIRRAGPMVLSNVSFFLEMNHPNWGLMDGPLKLEARERSADYDCYNVEEDPGEARPLPADACPDLRARAKALYKFLPRQIKRIRDRPTWGDP